MGVFSQHVVVRDSNVVEENKAIIKCIQSEFGSNVANSHPRQRFVGFQITYWDDESMGPVIFAIQH
jgi:hypothetical protein